jgi:23S rRNA pseudouridine1911/1915/1917 synthase
MQKFVVKTKDNQRLDIFVHNKMPKYSRSFVQKLIETDKVTVNSKRLGAGDTVHNGDVINIDFEDNQQTIPEISLPILYEDGDCLVLDKPSGILTHSKGAFNPEATVATFISPKVQGMTGDRAGIVHRLDRATSGVIICAKTPEALSWLQKQFSLRKVKKHYRAVIEGLLDPETAVIDMPIGRNPKSPKSFHVSADGRPAQTQYTTIEHKNGLSLLDLEPKTGRTHQLRVHLKQLNHPIIGDTLYGGREHKRLMLHAYKLEITLPNRQRREFIAPLPSEFHTILG